MFGATTRQTLVKVQIPIALPTILTGLTQTIMMALGIVVLVALVGAGGLGRQRLPESLTASHRAGRCVLTAMILDRYTQACVDGSSRPPRLSYSVACYSVERSTDCNIGVA